MEYELELEKAIKEIKGHDAELVLIQLPDGLKPKSKEITDEINRLALETDGVSKVTVLKARKLGLEIFVDMTIEVDKDMTVADAHLITAKVRRSVLKNVRNAKDILIHVEPSK